MSDQPYSFIVGLDRFQKNCRLTLEIEGDKIPLSFDDAIEFKIEIAQLLVTASPSTREVHGTLDPWRIRFSPNDGGFTMDIRRPTCSTRKLVLNTEQAEIFSEELQDFIDDAGQRT
jgi:hypothetical protein